MTGLLIYSLRVAVVMAIFYLFYRLLLSRETFHRLNRVVLLSTALFSFLLPLCIITITRTVEVAPIDLGLGSFVESADLMVEEQAGVVASLTTEILLLIFGAGVIGVLAWNAVGIISFRRLLRRGRRAEICGEQVTIVDQKIAPLSWFRHIVLSEQDAEECAAMIIAHEKAHIALRHSWDLTLVNLCCVAQWFNPAIWLLRSDLKDIHEYEADAEVLRSGIDARSYQLLLIKKTVGNKSYSIANSLNHSTLKKRITMMLSKKSSAVSRWKLLYALPVVALSLTAFAKQRTNFVIVNDSDNKVTQNSDNDNTIGVQSAATPEKESQYVVISDCEGSDTTKMDVRLSFEITDDGGQLFSGTPDALKTLSLQLADSDFMAYIINAAYSDVEVLQDKGLTIYGPEGSAVVSIDAEGNYQLNGVPSSLDEIDSQLAEWRGSDKEPKSILISVNESTPEGKTAALKEVLRKNGQLRITTINQNDFRISFDGPEGTSYKMKVVGDE